MRRTLLGLLAALAVGASTTLVAAPAQAASKPVTIKTISTRSIDWNGTALVKPTIKKAKKVKVLKRSMTIHQGGKVVRKNRTAVKLKPGTYRVTTKITFKYKGKKRGVVKKQRLIVKQGRCATKADYQSIKVSMTAGAGDAVAAVAKKVHSAGELMSDFAEPLTLGEWRDLFEEEGDAEGVAAFEALIEVYGEAAVLDVGFYTICKNPKKFVEIVYIDGFAVDKAVG